MSQLVLKAMCEQKKKNQKSYTVPGLPVLDNQTQSVDSVGGGKGRKILENTPPPFRVKAENYFSRNPSTKCSKRSYDIIRYKVTY